MEGKCQAKPQGEYLSLQRGGWEELHTAGAPPEQLGLCHQEDILAQLLGRHYHLHGLPGLEPGAQLFAGEMEVQSWPTGLLQARESQQAEGST